MLSEIQSVDLLVQKVEVASSYLLIKLELGKFVQFFHLVKAVLPTSPFCQVACMKFDLHILWKKVLNYGLECPVNDLHSVWRLQIVTRVMFLTVFGSC